jgi:hypothetical protein
MQLNLRFAGIVGAGLAVGALAYTKVCRPRFLRWGTLPEERSRRWPGDSFLPDAVITSMATRAITVHATPEAIWPWILQLGQDRGGFYSYSWLENLIGAEIHNVDRIVPEFQKRRVGDSVWMAPADKFDGMGRMTVALLEPRRALVLVSPQDWERIEEGEPGQDGSWTFILEPVDEQSTRLILRSRSGIRSRAGRLLDYLFWEPAHFVMERKMMESIKSLAELTDPLEAPGQFARC